MFFVVRESHKATKFVFIAFEEHPTDPETRVVGAAAVTATAPKFEDTLPERISTQHYIRIPARIPERGDEARDELRRRENPRLLLRNFPKDRRLENRMIFLSWELFGPFIKLPFETPRDITS